MDGEGFEPSKAVSYTHLTLYIDGQQAGKEASAVS